jgi:hypothetical protein
MDVAPEIMTALITAMGTLVAIGLKDILVSTTTERRARRRQLVERQIELAYAPLEYLIFALLHAEDDKRKTGLRDEIGLILRHYSYLLSEQTVSALYVLLRDEESGIDLLHHFVAEFDGLRQGYYQMSYTPLPPAPFTAHQFSGLGTTGSYPS